jgi:hypothetical protein
MSKKRSSHKAKSALRQTLQQMRDARFVEAAFAEREGRFADAIDLELAAYRLHKDAQAA